MKEEKKKNHFFILFLFSDKAGVKAVIFFTYDESAAESSVISMEVDKKTFMNVIKDSQSKVKSAKPLKFGNTNGFFKLLEGESTSFSFATITGTADCSCQCIRESSTTTPFIPQTTPITPRVITETTSKPSVTKPVVTIRTTPRPIVTTPTPRYVTEVQTTRTSTSGPTYLPPTTLGTVS